MNIQSAALVVFLTVTVTLSGCLGDGNLSGTEEQHSEPEIVTKEFHEDTHAAQYVGCNEVDNMCVTRSFPSFITFHYSNMTMLQLEANVTWGDHDDSSSIAGREVHVICKSSDSANCGHLKEPFVIKGSTSPLEFTIDMNVTAGTKVELQVRAEQLEAGPLWTSYEVDERVTVSGTIKLKD